MTPPDNPATVPPRPEACQQPVWDGGYRMQCARSIVNDECGRHGKDWRHHPMTDVPPRSATPPDASRPVTAPRPSVAAFAALMECVLRDNDHKGGWKECRADWLLMRLKQEVAELDEAMQKGTIARRDESGRTSDWPADIAREAADVANFAMMIVDVRGGLTPEREAAAATPSPDPLDVDALARDIELNIAWLAFTDEPYIYADGHATSVVRGDAGKRIAEWLAARLSVRTPETEAT